MSRTLGWGVVGIGNIVNGTIAPAMVADPECVLVAGTSRDQGRAEAFATRFGAARGYTAFEDMLADPEVEAVFIATPNALHADQVVAAATMRKHVLCDKPLAITADDAHRAVEACAVAGVALGINFHNRFMAWVQDVTALIGDGAIGDVQAIEVDVGSGPRRYDNWRADPKMAGLGTVHNVGVHALDFLSVILDAEPVEVTAVFDEDPAGGKVEMLALILVRFDSGALAYVNCNERVTHPRNEITIHGSGGRISGSGLTRAGISGDLVVRTGDGDALTHYPASQAHRLAVSAFTRAVLDGVDPSPSGLDGLRSARVCEAIGRSVRERRVVAVENGGTA